MKSISKLPEKWFIIRNKENHELINKWSSKRKGGGHNASLSSHSYFFSDKSYTDEKDATIGYAEITFEDFKTWVLGLDEANEEEEQIYEIY